MPKRKHHLTKRKNHSKIESMPPADHPIQTNVVTKPSQPAKIIIGAIIVLALIIIAVALNYFRVFNFFSSLQKTPVRPVNPHALDTCDLTKEGNPLVDNFSIQGGVAQGTLKGKITGLEKDEVRGSFIFKLQSLDKTQEYKFNIIDKENFIVNSMTNKIASASALKNDQLIKATFICNQETNLLEFSRLYILPNPPTASKSATLKK